MKRFTIVFLVFVGAAGCLFFLKKEAAPMIPPLLLSPATLSPASMIVVTSTSAASATFDASAPVPSTATKPKKKTITYVSLAPQPVTTFPDTSPPVPPPAPAPSRGEEKYVIQEYDITASLGTEGTADIKNNTVFTPSSYPENSGDPAFEAALLSAINVYRASHQLPSLAPSSVLYALAFEHTANMHETGGLNHDGFTTRFQQSQRMLCVENVGWNYSDPDSQLVGWQQSVEHNSALLHAEITFAGIARVGEYVTFFACK